MRILHTSDWHLGRQFHNVSLLEDQRYVLNQIIDIVKQKNVDVVLVAGDIFDRTVPPANAVALLDKVIDCISHELEVPLILISGNHDSAQRLSFGARQLAKSSVHIVGQLSQEPSPIVINDEYGEVWFYGIPYADPATVRDVLAVDVHSHEAAMEILTAQVTKHRDANKRCVVISHCFIDGGEASESERPLSIGGADKVPYKLFTDFHYTALGHLHGPQFKGKENIRYSGSILKYSFSETRHKKSVTLVELDKTGISAIDKIPLKPLRDMRVIEGNLQDIIDNAKDDPNPEDYLLVNLLDTHALYEPMAKLREFYPNVLQLQKPNLSAVGERQQVKRENLKKGEMPMFLDFYQQMAGEELGDHATKIVAELLDHIHQVQN